VGAAGVDGTQELVDGDDDAAQEGAEGNGTEDQSFVANLCYRSIRGSITCQG
jgi:hypothetical protein